MSESNIFFLILFAATLHAGWNLIIKSFTNSLSAIGFKLLFQSIIFIPFIFFVPLPTGITWFFIIGSVVLHNYYFINLGISYNKGDLSYVYPISRGCSPIFVTILSSLFCSVLNKENCVKKFPLSYFSNSLTAKILKSGE